MSDLTQSLKDAENSLRDFIAATLEKAFGTTWEEKLGVTEDRLAKWKERKEDEKRRQKFATVEERLLYYADFYDIKVILKKNWDAHFKDVFDDWKTIEVYLSELERLRDPDAHRRELLPHQKELAAGISGEIRNRIVRYRSTQETPDSYFPKIESVRDNLGNAWSPGSIKMFDTRMNLTVGTSLDFVITATDPYGEELEYCVYVTRGMSWQKENTLRITLNENHIGTSRSFNLLIRSTRNHHASGNWDDTIIFMYNVLPKRI